ncbi:unnamed protein product, partial [Ectocarpus fasciculatus]
GVFHGWRNVKSLTTPITTTIQHAGKKPKHVAREGSSKARTFTPLCDKSPGPVRKPPAALTPGNIFRFALTPQGGNWPPARLSPAGRIDQHLRFLSHHVGGGRRVRCIVIIGSTTTRPKNGFRANGISHVCHRSEKLAEKR